MPISATIAGPLPATKTPDLVATMKTVRDACELQPNSLSIKLSDQVEQLDGIITAEGNGKAFFDRTHITHGIPRGEERVVLKRPMWSGIADIARREFNDRLKAAKVLTGRWHTGTNLVDRLLGKELCVLAWSAETANADQPRARIKS